MSRHRGTAALFRIVPQRVSSAFAQKRRFHADGGSSHAVSYGNSSFLKIHAGHPPSILPLKLQSFIQSNAETFQQFAARTGGTCPLDASIIGFIEPLLNPVWVFLFVGEQPSRWAILGGMVIVSSVVVHTLLTFRSSREGS